MKIIIASAVAGLLTTSSAMSAELPALARKLDCSACHDIDKRVVGPAWMEVSKRYKGVSRYSFNGQEYALEDGLVMKISRGGSGNWGAMPMPGNDLTGAKQPEIRTLVRFILGLEK